MEKRSPGHGIKTPIAPPPSLRPSLLLTHYTRSFSIYTNYRFLQLTIAQTKAVKSFRKDEDFNEEDNFAHDEEEEVEEEEDDDEGDDIVHKY
jgi:hypothetical protein